MVTVYVNFNIYLKLKLFLYSNTPYLNKYHLEKNV